MNWFIPKVFNTRTICAYLGDDRTERGDHVDQDPSTAFVLEGEQDSFGPVSRYVSCEQCYRDSQEERRKELVRCDDCKLAIPSENVRTWKWYDFYAPQGDEPYHICESCWDAPAHVARMKKDDEERACEEEYYDGDNYYANRSLRRW